MIVNQSTTKTVNQIIPIVINSNAEITYISVVQLNYRLFENIFNSVTQ